jgi:hypothetical protein
MFSATCWLHSSLGQEEGALVDDAETKGASYHLNIYTRLSESRKHKS